MYHTYIVVTFLAPPQNTTAIRGSQVTISCGYKWHTALLTEWFINETVFNQQELQNSSLYQLNSPTSPMTYSLTVFSINSTTTFKCVVLSDTTTTSTPGTVTVIVGTCMARDGIILMSIHCHIPIHKVVILLSMQF